MGTEKDRSGPPKLEPSPSPPRLRKPMSSGAKLALMGGTIVALVTGYSLIPDGSGGDYSSPPITEEVDANETINMVVAGDGDTVEPPFDVITQEGAQVRTGFDQDWSATRSGRQILFADPSNTIACQSLVLPIDEFSEIMNQFSGGIGQYMDELAHTTAETAGVTASTVSRDALAADNLEDAGNVSWDGAKVVVDHSGPNGTVRRVNYVASSRTDDRGAILACASKESEETASVMERMVRAYRLESAGPS